ncbi:hypothetical protein C8J56DRAFT_887017 [Mycena floridula]|nr:hypothetical protein C8J56DRAFT_887017 [Mycena floridula]
MSEAMQPGPLADSDIFALQGFLMIIAVQFVLHGIYSALAIIVLYKLLTNKARLAAHHILIGASISMFYLIGDSIVVFRAWVLWTNHSGVHVLLCICLFGTFVGVTVDLVFGILFALSQLSDSPRFPPTGLRTLILMLPLLLTNLISTLLIACKVWYTIYPIIIILLLALQKDNLESTVNGQSFSQSLRFASRPQVSTATQSDDVTPDSTTGHINSVMPDSNMDDRPDSKTNDIAVAEPLGEKMEKHSSSHFG